MRTNRFACGALMAVCVFVAGCTTAPATERERDTQDAEVQSTITAFVNTDPGMQRFFDRSHGYAVFPSVGKGAFWVGGAYGKGQVFEQGTMIGWSDLTQATIGLQWGGQAYSEVIFFETRDALMRFTSGEFALAAQASAVAATAGASADAKFRNGIAVFTMAKGGLMAEASVGGQKFNFIRK
jgi:lipid-binding SYLF domain-containing protein